MKKLLKKLLAPVIREVIEKEQKEAQFYRKELLRREAIRAKDEIREKSQKHPVKPFGLLVIGFLGLLLYKKTVK